MRISPPPPRPSTLKLSLLVASGASLYLALGPHPPPRKGGCNHERICCIPHINPSAFCTKAKLAKGGAYLRDTMVHSDIYKELFVGMLQFVAVFSSNPQLTQKIYIS